MGRACPARSPAVWPAFDECILNERSRGSLAIEIGLVPIPSPSYLHHQRLVPSVQGGQLAHPSTSLGVPRVAPDPAVLRQNVPEPVQFTVLSQQVLPAQKPRLHIPDAHGSYQRTWAPRPCPRTIA